MNTESLIAPIVGTIAGALYGVVRDYIRYRGFVKDNPAAKFNFWLSLDEALNKAPQGAGVGFAIELIRLLSTLN